MKTSMYKNTQQGAALVVGLIVLLIMTLLGVTSMSLTTTELKASGNMQMQNYASQAGETASSLLMDSNLPTSVVDWTLTTPQHLVHSAFYPAAISAVPGGTLDVTVDITYQNCSKVTMGTDLTTTGQDSETLFNDMVHDMDVNGAVLSPLGTQIGESQRLRGLATKVVKCDKT